MTAAQPRMPAAAYRKGLGRPDEDSVHIPALVWVRENVSALALHVPNEANRSPREAQKQKARGLMAGAHDIIGAVEYGPLFGRWFTIEMKRPGETWCRVDDNQRRFGRMIVERGGIWTWATTPEQVQAWCYAQGIVKPRGWSLPALASDDAFELLL